MKRIAFLAFLLAGAIPAQAQVTKDSLTVGSSIMASSGAVVAATSTATLAAPAGTSGIAPAPSWLVTGVEISGTGATASSTVACTITGLMGGTQTVGVSVPAPVGSNLNIQYNFPGGLLGSPGTAIVFSCPTFGAGNLGAAINIQGIMAR